jgi:multisubunit Na+/H+ antiporter MnhG subunit
MPLDIRVPIGVMMGLMGLMLAGYGLFGPHDIYARSLGININLLWGTVLVIFAVVMLVLGTRRKGAR